MKSFCSYFNQGICQSCDLISLDYSDQINLKIKKIKNLLGEDFTLLPTIQSRSQKFRNKAKFVVTGTYMDPKLGLAGTYDLDNGRDISDCPLHLENIRDTIPQIKDFIAKAKLDPYRASSKSGELKGIIIFYSEDSKESYLRFILRSKEAISRIQKYQNELFTKISHLRCLSANIQPIPHPILEGEEEIILGDNPYIHHHMGGIDFLLGPRAFIQTNQEVAKKLYETASKWVREKERPSLLELYCGQGAFTFFSAPYISRGLGIEINPDAVKIANETVKKLNIKHIAFKANDAALIEDDINSFSPDIILVNPPRRGLGNTTKLLLDQKSKSIIYSSCNVDSLAFDLKNLSPFYQLKRAQVFDMFPNTNHFEILTELSLN